MRNRLLKGSLWATEEDYSEQLDSSQEPHFVALRRSIVNNLSLVISSAKHGVTVHELEQDVLQTALLAEQITLMIDQELYDVTWLRDNLNATFMSVTEVDPLEYSSDELQFIARHYDVLTQLLEQRYMFLTSGGPDGPEERSYSQRELLDATIFVLFVGTQRGVAGDQIPLPSMATSTERILAMISKQAPEGDKILALAA